MAVQTHTRRMSSGDLGRSKKMIKFPLKSSHTLLLTGKRGVGHKFLSARPLSFYEG